MASNQELKKAILNYINSVPGIPQKPKEIFRKLNLPVSSYNKMKILLRQLADDGKITRLKKRQYLSNKYVKTFTGTYIAGRYDYGFVALEQTGEEIFISEKHTGTALDGDTVRLELFAFRSGKNREGRIVEILERKRSKIVGTFQKSKNFGFVIPDDPKFSRDIYISAKTVKKARQGEKVVVSLDSWDHKYLNPEGDILEVLGKAGEKSVEANGIAISKGFSISFPDSVVKETEAIPMTFPKKEIERRMDLRNKFIFTIDPDDAKDFDDAVSLEKLKNGWELGIHIADASYYVTDGSETDREALKRSTSLYLADTVIPMLPHKLSDNLCSLMPQTDRLTFSVIMNLTNDGKVRDYTMAESVVHSKGRLSYEAAQEYIEKGGKNPFARKLSQMNDLSKVLRREREKNGSLDFDLPEVQFTFDKSGFPVKIDRKMRKDAHLLIEEFMLLANKVVAGYKRRMEKTLQMRLPYIYRVHDKPDGDKLLMLKEILKALGYKSRISKDVKPKAIQRILEDFSERPESRFIENLTLRSLKKAMYDTVNIGHFGLAFEEYSHFTSPIRRYPDLILHRILKLYQAQINTGDIKPLNNRLKHAAKIASEREIAASEAEREIIKLKQLEYMKQRLGDVYDGIITGVTSFGIFVELHENLAEGLVHVSDLADDYYIYEEANYRLIGSNGGNVYRLGDSVRVKVIKVDIEEKKMDLQIYYD